MAFLFRPAEKIDPRFAEGDGRIDVACALYPDAPKPWLDLSRTAAPWPYPAPDIAADEFARGMDRDAIAALGALAANFYRVPPSVEIVPLPGADAGLRLLPWLFRSPKRVAFLAPASAGIRAAWEAAGHSTSEVPSLDSIGKGDILVVDNPGHADGRIAAHAELAAALPALKRRDGLLVIDETLADADDTASMLPCVARLDSTVVLRSANTLHGAGGIPLGFAITSHPVAERFRAALGPNAVSAQAVAFGRAALADAGFAGEQRARLADMGGKLEAALAQAGLRIVGGTALFRLASTDMPHSLFDRLARAGILTRPFPKLDALRFSLPKDEADLARLQAALA
ncbi:aminotransferase class I/II-fold pyridoxal phosphate-dependent enzyme [Rhodomicrobium sp. Az07]|uniref:aminotransferase class I/II-fold pyridoxal phosphate-dependent enzyme n=1 Tax=Rhodomicrobium sp. Az07 TaxID=2839034 RepID=UPI001BE98712|nr:aminotransferase class I/II-fold pyridoxal phosphate-dependent enzyme [Rhodomicrobium sp. Az07]MBT3069682.1 aminotransferase class I/II-fold pyridoxal phosphate-dependent enzyme [Rhodomicrobium sp. Az07]